jgi:hypothetical protein
MKRLIIILIFVFMSLGYQYDHKARWTINPTNYTLWIRFCESVENISFEKTDLVPGDPLEGQEINFENIIQTVFDDFNNIDGSYLRLAFFPDDPLNPGDPVPGDNQYTYDAGLRRQIDVCVDSSSNPFLGGHAKSNINGKGERTYCKITLIESVKESVKNFVQTLTHELGHCLGLDHPQETRHAIMSYHYDREENMRLMIDDKMGIISIYPQPGLDLEENSTLGLSCSFKE